MNAPASPAAQAPQVLAGRHVLVTRPEAQAEGLARAIRAAGGQAVLFPVLAISGLEDPAPVLAAASRLAGYDFAVFVSANAIEKALSLILPTWPWPESLQVAAMGKSSEKALACFGFTDVIAPTERFDSEALLALPPFQDVAGKKVLVFRGDAGRELLGDTLQQRGATVDYVTCYRRSAPAANTAPLMDLWKQGRLDAVTLTSSEGLRNLYAMLDEAGRAHLAATPLFLPHRRILEEARKLGLTRLIATEAGDEGLLAGLIAHFTQSPRA